MDFQPEPDAALYSDQQRIQSLTKALAEARKLIGGLKHEPSGASGNDLFVDLIERIDKALVGDCSAEPLRYGNLPDFYPTDLAGRIQRQLSVLEDMWIKDNGVHGFAIDYGLLARLAAEEAVNQQLHLQAPAGKSISVSIKPADQLQPGELVFDGQATRKDQFFYPVARVVGADHPDNVDGEVHVYIELGDPRGAADCTGDRFYAVLQVQDTDQLVLTAEAQQPDAATLEAVASLQVSTVSSEPIKLSASSNQNPLRSAEQPKLDDQP